MNIAQHVERAASFFPDRAAILFEGKPFSYGELNARANQLANALRVAGVQRGDRVSLHLPNIPQFAVCYLAALETGAIAVSINPILKSDEVKYIVNDSGSVVLFTVGDLLQYVPHTDCPTLQPVVVCEGEPQGHAALDDWLGKGATAAKAADMQPGDPAVLPYTSATTGFPKGATLTHGNVVSNMYSTVHHAGYRPDDRMALFLMLFPVFGQNFIMNAAFTACATLVLYRRFVPEIVLDSMRRDRITMFLAVPTIYINLLNMDL